MLHSTLSASETKLQSHVTGCRFYILTFTQVYFRFENFSKTNKNKGKALKDFIFFKKSEHHQWCDYLRFAEGSIYIFKVSVYSNCVSCWVSTVKTEVQPWEEVESYITAHRVPLLCGKRDLEQQCPTLMRNPGLSVFKGGLPTETTAPLWAAIERSLFLMYDQHTDKWIWIIMLFSHSGYVNDPQTTGNWRDVKKNSQITCEMCLWTKAHEANNYVKWIIDRRLSQSFLPLDQHCPVKRQQHQVQIVHTI